MGMLSDTLNHFSEPGVIRLLLKDQKGPAVLICGFVALPPLLVFGVIVPAVGVVVVHHKSFPARQFYGHGWNQKS